MTALESRAAALIDRQADRGAEAIDEWAARGYVWASDVETHSTRLLRCEGVTGLCADGRRVVLRHDVGGR
jgi:hypothetical protein